MRTIPNNRPAHGRRPSLRVGNRAVLAVAATDAPAAAPVDDPFIASVLQLAESLPPASSAAADLRRVTQPSLSAMRMPTTRVEEFRYTDISTLLAQSVVPPLAIDAAAVTSALQACKLEAADATRVVIVDGRYDQASSSLSALPEGAYVGELAHAPQSVLSQFGMQTAARGGVFAQLNSATATSCVVVHVPDGMHCEVPLHVVYLSSGANAEGSVAGSSPRLLISAGSGAAVEIVEEFLGLQPEQGAYLVNTVAEVAVAEGASVRHGYVQTDSAGGYHMKTTVVDQAESSSYELTETRLGGLLSRHDVNIQQLGPKTVSRMKHFLLCSKDQLHDLHTKLRLDHPEGTADQLHKCIVSDSSARGVFDGNVYVNKPAQKTDAGQLSRNLLLVPKATVNVKPNLQIIADDVKCTHGCAVSDLSPEEMFYFRARGIDAESARKVLVFSFGAEVMQQFRYKELVDRLQTTVNEKLNVL